MDDKKTPVSHLDLTKYSRDSDKILTRIRLYWDFNFVFEWIKLGQIRVRNKHSVNFPGLWDVSSYFGENTDREHDSAFICMFGIVCVEFLNINYGLTRISAYIDPNRGLLYDTFNVPTVDYDPFVDCEDCKICEGEERHKLVKYLPPHNMELYKKVRGKKIEIITGVH